MKKEPKNSFNAGDFSSRKLLDMVDNPKNAGRERLNRAEIEAVIRELATRRHYLRELRDRGFLAPRAH